MSRAPSAETVKRGHGDSESRETGEQHRAPSAERRETERQRRAPSAEIGETIRRSMVRGFPALERDSVVPLKLSNCRTVELPNEA